MVRIARIETIALNYPTQGRFKFFEDHNGRPIGRPSVLVKITTDDGTVGWGQSVPVNKWSYETTESVQSTIDRYLAPVLIGMDVFDAPHIQSVLDKVIAPSFSTGQPICKAGIDLALFDLTGKLLKQTAQQRWKRTGLSRVTISYTLNPVSLNDVPRLIEDGRRLGYRNFNIKVAPNPEFDIELTRLVKKLVPDGFLWADANCGYDEETALQAARKLADAGAAVLEQPLRANRITGYQKLKKLAALPIILDEGVVDHSDLAEFIKLDMLDGVAIKPPRCGGITEACHQIRMLEENGLMILGSGLTDPDLSLAASLLVFGAHTINYPAALNGCQFLTTSVLRAPFSVENGELPVPSGYGLGVEVDEDKVSALSAANVAHVGRPAYSFSSCAAS